MSYDSNETEAQIDMITDCWKSGRMTTAEQMCIRRIEELLDADEEISEVRAEKLQDIWNRVAS